MPNQTVLTVHSHKTTENRAKSRSFVILSKQYKHQRNITHKPVRLCKIPHFRCTLTSLQEAMHNNKFSGISQNTLQNHVFGTHSNRIRNLCQTTHCCRCTLKTLQQIVQSHAVSSFSHSSTDSNVISHINLCKFPHCRCTDKTLQKVMRNYFPVLSRNASKHSANSHDFGTLSNHIKHIWQTTHWRCTLKTLQQTVQSHSLVILSKQYKHQRNVTPNLVQNPTFSGNCHNITKGYAKSFFR